ncbi:MAG: phospholipase, partial [Burkholderiaceae bacterium]
MGKLNLAVAALGAALVIAGCGGGDTRRSAISSVRVVGDSLSDSGTFAGVPGFGRIFSVQGPTAQNWVERTAADFGVSGLCEVYKFTGAAFVANPVAGCTNYAIAGGRINNPTSAGGAASPVSIVKQLQDAGATYSYSAKDLLLVDGGGNDAADLIGAYLSAGKDGGASYAAL